MKSPLLSLMSLVLGIGSAAVLASRFTANDAVDYDRLAESLTPAPLIAVDTSIEEKRLLETEIKRVRAMEKELRRRSRLLEEVFRGVEELELSFASENDELNTEEQIKLGIGGGDIETASFTSLPLLRLHTNSILEKLDNQIGLLKSMPIGTPVPGRVSSSYGHRRSPFTGKRQMHHGVDFSVSRHTPIHSTGDGVIVKAGRKGAFGRLVEVDHGHGVTSVYAHLQKITVKIGQKVCRGQEIGRAGSSGRSTAPHLHYEVRHEGASLNPHEFIELAELISLF